MITVLRLSVLLLAGKRYWLLPLLPLLWLGVQALLRLLRARQTMEPATAQDTLTGVPVEVLAIFLGGRVVTGELDQRNLEIAYTVPGGAHRVWPGKLAAAGLLLTASVALVAASCLRLLHTVPRLPDPLRRHPGHAAMGFATLLRSEVADALASVALLGFNGLITGFGSQPVRVSPLWNPLAIEDIGACTRDPEPDRHRPGDRRDRRADLRPC